MICQNCKCEVSDQAVFCTKCGKKIEKIMEETKVKGDKRVELMFCIGCGSRLKPEVRYCTKCGRKIETADITDNVYQEKVHNDYIDKSLLSVNGKTDKIQNSSKIIVAASVSIVVCAVIIGIGCKLFLFDPKEDLRNKDIVEVVSETTQEISEEIIEKDPLGNVNFNLNDNKVLSFTGFVKKAGDEWILQWNDGKSFGIQGEDGNPVCINNATSAFLDETELPKNMLSDIKEDEQVTMTGEVEIVDNVVQITPTEITDDTGTDRIALFEDKDEDRLEEDYIIPYSDTYLLTEEDVEDLTVQEINYAKNEIYARHGRKFESNELQEYFNSKDWYDGTIEPEDFKKGNYLSDVENENAVFLREVENKMGKYPLDK